MSSVKTSPWSSKLMKDLLDSVSPKNPNASSVNNALDKLITEIYSRNSSPPPTVNEWLSTMKICCDKIGSDNPLLLAKCANILLMLVNTHQVSLGTDEVDFVVSWCCRSLAKAPDIVYLDFLQLLDALMKSNPSYFSLDQSAVIDILSVKLEDKTTVSLPQDVRLWRVACLKTLASCAPASSFTAISACFFDLIFSLEKGDTVSYCQIWIKVLEGFEVLCSRSSEWISNVLQHLVVAIHSAMTTGLDVQPSPALQFPTHVMIPSPAQLPPIRPAVRLKKKHKGKVKQIPWPETRSEERLCPVEITSWVSSDSEHSDSESGGVKRSKKLEAQVRHAAYNLFIHVVKLVGCKSILEWYCALFCRLIDAVQFETYCKPRLAVFGALTQFLSGSRMFLAQAQESEGKSFTSFSEILAVQLTTLHTALVASLERVNSDKQLINAMFLVVSALVKVTPYHRLKEGLFDSLLAAIKTFSCSKDRDIVCYVLQCLLEIVILNSDTGVITNTIASQLDDENEPWVVKYALVYLDEDVNGIRTFSWGVISGLCACHFKTIQPHVLMIENKILSDMMSDKSIVPLLKALASILEHYSNDVDYVNHALTLWDVLLEQNSPFIRALQEEGKSAVVACDCLSLIGPKKFHMLSEDKKILIITMVFGCCSNETQVVRHAALNVLSNLLSYPQMSGEIQFVCDAKDYLIRALKDPVENVRVKAAWAFSNLVDLIVDSKDEELLNELSTIQLFEAALTLSSDTQKVKQNILRAIGHTLLLVSAEDAELPKWKAALEKGCQMLQHCATSGSLMKMRWNACHAIATMLTNESLYDTLLLAMPTMIQTLCTIVVSCNNFKVRMNACLALSAIRQRRLYGSLYIHVWQSLLEGLDNAANMPDFSEFKHQHGLVENLCSAICHVACFVKEGDLVELKEILEPRLNFLSSHLIQCQERVTPEQAGALLRASSHIESISKTISDGFVENLYNAFRAAQICL